METETFKERLKSLNLSLTDFSELTNLSYSAVSKFGKSNPIPPWVEPFLNFYQSAKQLDIFKELIFELSEKLKK